MTLARRTRVRRGWSKQDMLAKSRTRGACLVTAMLLLAALHGSAAYAYDNGSTDAAEAEWAHRLWKEGAGLHLEADYRGAIERYRRALQLQPTARIHTYLAWSLSRIGRYQEAIRHCRRAIALDPDYPNAYNDLGAYLIDLGRPGEAIPWLRRAIEISDYCCPHYAHYQLGRAFLLQAKVAEARRELEASLSIRPNYGAARRLLQGIHARNLKGL